MDPVASIIKRFGLVASLSALAGALFFAPAASASDTFTLKNESSQVTLTGVSNWTGPEQYGPQSFAGCQTGPWPASDSTAYEFPPGTTGTLTMTRDPFSSCPSNIDTQSFNLTRPSTFGNGWWAPVDPPIGFASLTCAAVGQNPSLVTAQVDDDGHGLTCTVSDAAARAAASFVSSAAPMRNGDAVALVQHFPGSAGAAGVARGIHEITLRDKKGNVHGREQKMLVSGRPRKVRIPISRALRKRVAKRGFAKVKATLKRSDDEPGTGHRATLVVMRDRPGLPF